MLHSYHGILLSNKINELMIHNNNLQGTMLSGKRKGNPKVIYILTSFVWHFLNEEIMGMENRLVVARDVGKR